MKRPPKWPPLRSNRIRKIRKAIELQGFEENRHARLLLALTSTYRIPVQTPPRFTSHALESDFLSAGYGECLDSFFAFGLYSLALESGYFTPQLTAVFEPVVSRRGAAYLVFRKVGTLPAHASVLVAAVISHEMRSHHLPQIAEPGAHGACHEQKRQQQQAR